MAFGSAVPSVSGAFDVGMAYTDFTPTGDITTIAALQTWADANVRDASGSWSATVHKRILLGAGRTYTGSVGFQLHGYSHTTFEGGGTETSGTDGAVTYGAQTGGASVVVTGSANSTDSSGFRSGSGAASPASDIRFHGLHIEGTGVVGSTVASTTAGDGGEYQMSWCFYGVSDILIDHCTADKCKGDGIYISALRPGRLENWSSNITLRYSTISNNGRMGLGIIAVDGLLVSHCRFTDICYAILDMEPNKGNEGASNVEMSDCLIDGTYYSWDTSFNDSAFLTANSVPDPAWDSGTSSYTGTTESVFTGYIRFLRNRLTAAMGSGGSAPTFRFQAPTVGTKTAILTIEDNVCAANRAGPICNVFGWSSNGHVIQNNTGFKNATGSWYNDLGGMGTVTQTGNT